MKKFLFVDANGLYEEFEDYVGEGLKDDGSDAVAIDWSTAFNDAKAVKAEDLASTSNGKGASIIGIEDSGSIITATTVEGALAEIQTDLDAVEDNGIASTNGTITTSGTIGGDDLDIDINWSTTYDDAKAVKAEDLSSVSNGKGASIIGVEDSAGYFTGTDVEAVLAELYLETQKPGVKYTVGVGGVSAGDLVYVSANDTVLPYTTLSDSHRGIGLAFTTELAAATVKVAANDSIIEDVITSLSPTAGDPIYWDGSALSKTIPNGSGDHVWQAGVAKNADDLHVEVRYIKKNA